MSQLMIRNVSKFFGDTIAVDNAALCVSDGELVCLLGPSGSGKSTLLRMVGGFEAPSQGDILIDGSDVTDLPPERRPTGMVFQSHALWSHMNVFNNIAYGLKIRRLPREEIREKVEAVLALVGLEGYSARQTHQLSGGQQQRVALARALVLEPKILLLDEPFASLDQHLRERLREEVRDIQQRVGITTLFVTHGQDEALALADRIVVMSNGRIEQADSPDLIYRVPETQFVAGFVGSMNFIEGHIKNGQFSSTDFCLPFDAQDGPATLAVRPEALKLARAANVASAAVYRMTDFGSHFIVDINLADGSRLKALAPPTQRWQEGEQVAIHVADYTVFRDQKLLVGDRKERQL